MRLNLRLSFAPLFASLLDGGKVEGFMRIAALIFLFFTIFSAPVAAQKPTFWTTWQSANAATNTAMERDNYPEAEKAAKTAVILYPEQAETFNPETYIVLLDNAVQLVFANTQSEQAASRFLVPKVEYLLEREEELPTSFVEFGLMFAQLYVATPLATADKSLHKEKAELVREVEEQITGLTSGASSAALAARYYTLMAERNTKKRKYIRRELTELLDRSMSVEYHDISVKALSALAGYMTSRFKDHEEAIELVKIKSEEIGPENIPRATRKALFEVVAASMFLDFGPEKAEKLLNSAEILEAPELTYDEDGQVQLQPLRRYEPYFRNITSRKVIVLSFTVNRKGKTENIEIRSSDLSSVNNDAAIEAVKLWRYLPAFYDGQFQPVEDVRVAFTVEPPRRR